MNYVERTKQRLDAQSCAVRGKPGKSAYEVAVQEGYSGTKAEWLASLVGPQGPQGIQGTGALIVNDQSSNLPATLDTTATVSASDLYDVNATPAAGDIVIGSYTGRICLATSAVSEGSFGVKGTGKTLMAALGTTVGQHEEQINGLDTAIDVLNGEKHLVYCASDVPTQPGYQHYTTVLKSQFSPEPKSGDAVLGRNMYFGVVVSISGNDVTLGGTGIAMLPKNFDVLSSLSVLAVNGVGGNIDADGKLTITRDASVGGKLTVTGDADVGGNLTLAAGKTVQADAVSARGIVLSDGVNGHTPVSIYGANDEIELIGDNDGPVSLLNVKDISASGDVSVGGDLAVTGAATFNDGVGVTGDISASGDLNGTDLNLTNASNKSVQIEVSAENTVYFNGTSDAPVVIGNVDTPTSNGHAANKSYVDSAVSGKANASNPSLSGTITITDTNNARVYVANTGDVLVLAGNNHSDAVEIGNVATPTTNGSAANKSYVDSVAGVTAANVAAAIGNMTAAQAAQAVEDLGAAPAEIVSAVSGATPTITPVAGTTYKCGELTSLTISNPPATGAWAVVFTSGSTATTTTIPSTILGLESFAAAANTIYEINVLDNRAVVGSWAVSV